MSPSAGQQREALRQQQLLRALWRRGDDAAVALWSRELPQRTAQALAAYRGNAAATAQRALALAYPTVQQLVGDDSFDLLAQAFWHRHAPTRGDLAQHGAELAVFIEADAQLASEPYLADVARLDWAVHAIEQAADAGAGVDGLERLAHDDPAALRLVPRPGAALQRSRWPVVTIWHAHRSTAPDRFDAVQAMLRAGHGEAAWLWRDGWRAAVQALAGPQAAFVEAVLEGATLAHALTRAGDAFSFEDWLRDALTRQWLSAVVAVASIPTGETS